MTVNGIRALKISRLTVPYLGILASLQLIDPSVANIALVKASDALQMHGSVLALGASVSTLAQAASVLVMGFLGDRFGRRKVLAASLLLALIGNLLSMLASEAGIFLIGRALTGIALGSVLTSTFASVRFVTPTAGVSAALGLWNLLIVVGFITGSLIGGWMATIDWRLAFLLVPLICTVSLVLLPTLVPAIAGNRSLKPDLPGLTSIAIAMVLFLFGINHAALGLRSPSFWLPSLSGLLLFALHITIERRSHQPIFPPKLYLRGFFAAAVINGIGWNVAQAVVQLQTSNFWQLVQGYSTSAVALGQLPFLICFGVAGIYAGRWMGPGRRTLVLMGGGSLALVVGLALFAIVQVQTPYWQLLPALMLAGFGLAFVAVPQSALFVQEAPEHCFGSVLAFRTTSGQLGFAFGLAASGTMISGFGFNDLHTRMQGAGLGLEHITQIDEQIRLFLRNSPISLEGRASRQLMQLLQEAYTQGLAGTMLVVSGLTALLLAISLLLLIIGREQQLLGQERLS